MREYIKIIETMMLREFIFSHGDTVQSMLQLNVFLDMEEPEQMGFSEEFIEEWRGESDLLRKRIESMPPLPLLPEMVDALEDVHYDGSDAYQEGEEETLSSLYSNQLDVCEEICGQIDEILADPTAAKDMIIRSLLTAVKNNSGSPALANSMITTISALRNQGYDYPELASIEKSLRSQGLG
jgi:hypothetical protein